jgi:hypothetical protein
VKFRFFEIFAFLAVLEFELRALCYKNKPGLKLPGIGVMLWMKPLPGQEQILTADRQEGQLGFLRLYIGQLYASPGR